MRRMLHGSRMRRGGMEWRLRRVADCACWLLWRLHQLLCSSGSRLIKARAACRRLRLSASRQRMLAQHTDRRRRRRWIRNRRIRVRGG